MTDTSTPLAQKPTRFRYVILFLLCMLAMITYMDRAANASAKTSIMAELKIDKEQFFIVLMAFQLAYALFEIPSGWLGDSVGPRSTLIRIVLWWSVFVFVTGFVGMTAGGIYFGFTLLIVVQFLFGVGEAGAFPNIAKGLYNWFPASDRGFAKSAVWMSARCMGGLTPLLWVLLVELGGVTWREALWLFAAVAALWVSVFIFLFRNRPQESKYVNAAEIEIIDRGRTAPRMAQGKFPWKKLFGSRNLWAVCIMYIVTNFCWYFLMYNHPGAMQNAYPEMSKTDSGKITLALLSGAPLLIGMFGCLLGGILSDRYIRRTGNRKWGRRMLGIAGYAGAGLCYFAAAGVKSSDPTNLWAYAGLLILMGFMNDLIMAPAWAVCQDIGQQYAATVSGAMNMVGNLFGAVSGILVTGLILDHYKNTDPTGTQGTVTCFILYGIVYFCGVATWFFIDASKPLVSPED